MTKAEQKIMNAEHDLDVSNKVYEERLLRMEELIGTIINEQGSLLQSVKAQRIYENIQGNMKSDD